MSDDDKNNMSDFDQMAYEFTLACFLASKWKEVYPGAAYSTRIAAAIATLEVAIERAKENPNIAKQLRTLSAKRLRTTADDQ